MFGKKKQPKKKSIRTYEYLIENDLKRIVDKKAYFGGGTGSNGIGGGFIYSTKWICIQNGQEPSKKDIVIAELHSLPENVLVCKNKEHESKLREFAKDYRMRGFETEYYE